MNKFSPEKKNSCVGKAWCDIGDGMSDRVKFFNQESSGILKEEGFMPLIFRSYHQIRGKNKRPKKA